MIHETEILFFERNIVLYFKCLPIDQEYKYKYNNTASDEISKQINVKTMFE
jgi:hypothetical protein